MGTRALSRIANLKSLLPVLILATGFASEASAKDYAFVRKWPQTPGGGSGNGQFLYPRGVAFDGSGNLYVADTNNSRIQKFTAAGAYLTQWGSYGTGDGQFDLPRAIAVDTAGNVYVVDTNNNRIQKFTSTGTYLTQLGAYGYNDGQFWNPAGVAVDALNNVYVADTNNQRIQKFTFSGTYLTQWGTMGVGNSQFQTPTGVAVDGSGNVYVADTTNHRIQKFTSAGVYLTQWGTSGVANGEFKTPIGIAVASSGNVYVAEMYGQRIQEFTSAGAYLTHWGTFGSGDGQLMYPQGLAVDASGNVFVADEYNDRVQEFAPATGTLYGALKDFVTDARLACAAVRISSSALGIERIVVADLNGAYQAASLPPAAYTVDAFAAGYDNSSSATSVIEAASTRLDFRLQARTASSSIHGVVTDANTSLPLVGARVDAVVGGATVATTYTCADGNYELANPILKTATSVTLLFSAPNYDTKSLDISVSPGETQTVSASLTPKIAAPGALTGTITNHSTGLPLNGARVTVSGAANCSTDSDSNGVYSFAALPEGTYTVDASANGFTGQYQVADLTSLGIQQVDFSLTPGIVDEPEDIDGTGNVDAVDVQLVINRALGIAITGNADVNRDGDVTAVDVQLVINRALGLK